MMTVGVGMGTLVLPTGRSLVRLVFDYLDHFVFNQSLQGSMIDIFVGDLALLAGAEMEYLAAGKGNADGGMSLVPNGLHDGSS